MSWDGSRTDEHPILGWERRARTTEFVAGVLRPVLRDGLLATDEVVERAISRLGGSALDSAHVQTALEAMAMTAEVQARPHDGRKLWQLSGGGRARADREIDQARDLLRAYRREFTQRARRAGLALSMGARRDHYFDIVLTAVFEGGVAGHRWFDGRIHESHDQALLFPSDFDRDVMVRRVRSETMDSRIERFLIEQIDDALDPDTGFLRDIVLAFGAMNIYRALLGRRDARPTRAVLGHIHGMRLVVETSWTVGAHEDPRARTEALATIEAAVRAGMTVVLSDHIEGELVSLLDYVEDDASDGLADIDRSRHTTAAREAKRHSLVRMFLTHRRHGACSTWSDFRSLVTGFVDELKKLGVECVSHGRYTDAGRKALAKQALRDAVDARPTIVRLDPQINIDSISIAMTEGLRQVNPGNGLLPAALIIGFDTVMNDAYRRLNRDDPIPIMVTPEVLATLISECRSSAGLDDLVEDEIALDGWAELVAAGLRYPLSVVREIAASLRGDASAGGTPGWRREDLAGLLRDLEDTFENRAKLAVRMVDRMRRVEVEKEREDAARWVAEKAAESQAEVDRTRTEAEERVSHLTAQVERAQAVRDVAKRSVRRLETELERTHSQAPRFAFVASVVALLVGVGVGAAATGWWGGAALMAGTAGAASARGRWWLRDPSGAYARLVLEIMGSAAAIGTLITFFRGAQAWP